MIRLRFVTGNGMASRLIRTQGGLCMPFCPSHVETVSQDGKSYIGQHMDGGMQGRPVGYDLDSLMTLPDGRKSELIVNLPCTPQQEAAYYAFITGKIGQPYDWQAIVSFAAPDINLHDFDHMICSAITVAGLRTKGCEYFKMPLTVPFHHISPRDLLLILSSHVQIDH